MNLKSDHQLEVTRQKLRALEERYQAAQHRPFDNEHLRELTLRSLKKLINQFKEEIARFEAGVGRSAS